MRLCSDMNLKEAQEYANKLKKAEKMQKLREEVCCRLTDFIRVLSSAPVALLRHVHLSLYDEKCSSSRQ